MIKPWTRRNKVGFL